MRVLFILLTFFIAKVNADVPSLSEVRGLYLKSATEEESCKKLISILQSYNENNNALFAGYKACATMMMANYVFNPFRKLSNFNEGKSLLEKSIEADEDNVELRFLRFSIQANAPSFLGYSKSIQTDKLFLINSFSKIKDMQLKQLINSLLINSDLLSRTEKQNIRS